MTKTLELTGEQQTILRELLERELGDMSYEIADTDNSVFKAQLKDRRDALKVIQANLGS